MKALICPEDHHIMYKSPWKFQKENPQSSDSLSAGFFKSYSILTGTICYTLKRGVHVDGRASDTGVR